MPACVHAAFARPGSQLVSGLPRATKALRGNPQRAGGKAGDDPGRPARSHDSAPGETGKMHQQLLWPQSREPGLMTLEKTETGRSMVRYLLDEMPEPERAN